MSKSPIPSTASAAAWLLELEPEPLSEQRWSKIEQAVFARVQRGEAAPSLPQMPRISGARRYAPWLAAAAALVMVVVVLVVGPLGGGDSAAAVSRISTGAAASHLGLPGLSLDLSPESTVVVSGGERESTLIVVDRGEVACDVAHRRPGAPLVVQAGEVRVEVVGTRFRVMRQGESARVTVQEGVVKVSSRGRTVPVRAGQSWPEVASPSAGKGSPAERSLEAPALEAVVAPESAQRPRTAKGPATRLAPPEVDVEPSAPAPPEPSTEQRSFETATRLERSKPQEAIALYRSLEVTGGSWAQNALFAHGRLEAARGNRGEALRILKQYLARFPQGANAQDARMLVGRLE